MKEQDMCTIGLLSDTHGVLDKRFLSFFDHCDEIWHAGDLGYNGVLDRLEAHKPVRAVYGNVDGYDLRCRVPEHQRFSLCGVDVWMTHIGGYPGRYDRRVRERLYQYPPKLFISGHSHILKVMYDNKLGLLHINPGAAGTQGFHQMRTAVRFRLHSGTIEDLEVFEFPRQERNRAENTALGK